MTPPPSRGGGDDIWPPQEGGRAAGATVSREARPQGARSVRAPILRFEVAHRAGRCSGFGRCSTSALRRRHCRAAAIASCAAPEAPSSPGAIDPSTDGSPRWIRPSGAHERSSLTSTAIPDAGILRSPVCASHPRNRQSESDRPHAAGGAVLGSAVLGCVRQGTLQVDRKSARWRAQSLDHGGKCRPGGKARRRQPLRGRLRADR